MFDWQLIRHLNDYAYNLEQKTMNVTEVFKNLMFLKESHEDKALQERTRPKKKEEIYWDCTEPVDIPKMG